MLTRHLENAIKEVGVLITLTEDDILLIKDAKHDELAQKAQEKHHAVLSFETTKSLLNHELSKLAQSNDGALDGVLSAEEEALLEAFKERLGALKSINLRYSKIVLSVNEFYSTLFNRMFAFDSQGYQKTKPLPAAMLQVSA